MRVRSAFTSRSLTNVAAIERAPDPLWAHFKDAGAFRVDALAAHIDTARLLNHDWGALTIFDQPLHNTGGVLWGIGQANNTARLQSAIYNGGLRHFSTSAAGSPQLNSTVAGAFGPTGHPDFCMVEFDHQVTSQVVRAWTKGTGPTALGSFADGAFWAPDRYAVGAWPRLDGEQVKFGGHILAHVFWYTGGNGNLLTPAQAAAVQAAFNAPGALKTRVRKCVETLIGIHGSRVKYAQIYTLGSAPLVGPSPVVSGVVEYSKIARTPDPAQTPRRVAAIGNSRTRDTLGWHTTGGVSLQVLQDVLTDAGHPATTSFYDLRCSLALKGIHDDAVGTCGETVGGIGEWDAWTELADVVIVQPYEGGYPASPVSTLATDVAAIQAFVATQSATCDVVLLCVSPGSADLFTNMGPSPPPLSPPIDPDTIRSRLYFDALWDALLPIYGKRLRLAPAAHAWHAIGELADGAGFPGLASSGALYRDTNHGSKEGCAISILTAAGAISGKPVHYPSTSLDVSSTFANAAALAVRDVLLADPRTRVLDA